MKDNQYIAIVGDLVKSRKTPDREGLQKKLLTTLKYINREFALDFYAPFKITRGDEIAGVILSSKNLYSIISTLKNLIFPYFIRVVVKSGILNTGLSSKDAAIIDGPAFKAADDLLRKIKKEDNYFFLDLDTKERDEAITFIVNLIEEIKKKWTLRQKETIELYKKLHTQEKVAKKLGITQQGVAKILKRANFDKIAIAEQWINKRFQVYN